MPQASEHRNVRGREPVVIATQPKSLNRTFQRTVSQERPNSSYVPSIITNATSQYKLPRPLPPRPIALEELGKLDRGRSSKRNDLSRSSASSKRGPLKADHSINGPGSSSGRTNGFLCGNPSTPPSSRDSERRTVSLSRSKSISQGDLSEMRDKGEELSRILDSFALNARSASSNRRTMAAPPLLQRSSSLKRLSAFSAFEGKGNVGAAAVLLSSRTNGITKQPLDSPPDYDQPQHNLSNSATMSKHLLASSAPLSKPILSSTPPSKGLMPITCQSKTPVSSAEERTASSTDSQGFRGRPIFG